MTGRHRLARMMALAALLLGAISLAAPATTGAMSFTLRFPPPESGFLDFENGIDPRFEVTLLNNVDGITPTSEVRDCVVQVAEFSDPADPRWSNGGAGVFSVEFNHSQGFSGGEGNGVEYRNWGFTDIAPQLFPTGLRPAGPFSRFARARCTRYTVDPGPPQTKTFDRYELSNEILTLPINPRPNPQCLDGADNDGDALADTADPDCTWFHDNTEQIVLPTQLTRSMLRRAATYGAERSISRSGKPTQAFDEDDNLYQRIKCRKRSPRNGLCDFTWVPNTRVARYIYGARVLVQTTNNLALRESSEIHTSVAAVRVSLRCIMKRKKRCREKQYRVRKSVQRDICELRPPAPSIIYSFYSHYDHSFQAPLNFDYYGFGAGYQSYCGK